MIAIITLTIDDDGKARNNNDDDDDDDLPSMTVLPLVSLTHHADPSA